MITFSPSPCARATMRVEIGQRAELRVDVAVVGDVVAHVRHRRGEDRRQPDRVDPELGDIGQPPR